MSEELVENPTLKIAGTNFIADFSSNSVGLKSQRPLEKDEMKKVVTQIAIGVATHKARVGNFGEESSESFVEGVRADLESHIDSVLDGTKISLNEFRITVFKSNDGNTYDGLVCTDNHGSLYRYPGDHGMKRFFEDALKESQRKGDAED